MNLRILSKRVAHHLADPHSRLRQIAVGVVWVSAFVFIGKLAGAAKEMAIDWRYGVSETVDAYDFVFNIVYWPIAVWFSILTVVLVPLFARIGNDNPLGLSQFRRELMGFTLLLGFILGILIYLGLSTLLHAGWSGLSEGALLKAQEWMGPLSLLVPLGFVISLFSAWMLAYSRHRNTLFEAIPAFVILVALVLPPSWVPEPLIWGTIAGFALHMSGLAAPLYTRGELQTPRFSFQSPAWSNFWSGIGIMAIGQALMSFTGVIDQFFAAHLGPGAVSTLSYANRILALVLGLGALAIGRATLPVFSEAFAKQDQKLRYLILRWSQLMFVAGLAALIVGWIFSPLVVKILFERGAFDAKDTQEVATILRFSLLQVPFYFLSLVLVSGLSSLRRYRTIASIAGLNLFLKIIINFMLATYFHLTGLVIATAIMYAVSAALCIFALRADIHESR